MCAIAAPAFADSSAALAICSGVQGRPGCCSIVVRLPVTATVRIVFLLFLTGASAIGFHPDELTINKRLFTSAFFQIADGESSVRKASAVKVANVKAAGAKAASAKRRPRAVAAQALPSVRERILEVAERMFAEYGMSGVGL